MLADLRPAGFRGRPLAELAELLGVKLRGPGVTVTVPGITVSGVTHDSRRVLAEIGPVVMATGQGRVQVAWPDAA